MAVIKKPEVQLNACIFLQYVNVLDVWKCCDMKYATLSHRHIDTVMTQAVVLWTNSSIVYLRISIT